MSTNPSEQGSETQQEGHGPVSESAEPSQPKRETRRPGFVRQWLATLILCVTYLIVGSSVGWPSPTLYRMQNSGKPFNVTPTDITLMTGVFYLGNMAMPIPGSLLNDFLGRRTSIFICNLLPFSSWLLIYFATFPAMIHVARLLVGMWSGFTLAVVPLYLAEIADPKIRGALSTLAQFMVNLGDVLAYGIGPYVSYYTLALSFGSFPVFLFVLLFIVPESPYWLVSKRTEEKAAKSLAWFQAKPYDEALGQVRELRIQLENDEHVGEKGFKALFKSKGNMKALMIVLVLMSSQRLSGISCVMAYSSVTLPDANIWGLRPNGCVIVYGVSWLIAVVVVMFLVDRFGRIPLLMISCAGCAASMSTACVWYAINPTPMHFEHPWIPFLAFFFYGLSFMLGLGPLPTTVQGEMLPPKLKAVASGISAMVAAGSSALMVGIYLVIAKHIGIYFNFLLNALVSIGAGLFTYFYAIETKGKTLHEIQLKLNS